MKNQLETGQIIAELRKQAGFTQKALAETLCVTDKAVSKWERGLACPDISLLPKLSTLLDSDIEALLSGASTIRSHLWKGVLFLDSKVLVDTIVFDKPMVYYLLSTFMLLGISEILIIGDKINIELVKKLFVNEEQFGLRLCFSVSEQIDYVDSLNSNKLFVEGSNTLVITKPLFLFAYSLTRQLHFYISLSDEIIRLKHQNGDVLPVFFINTDGWKQILSHENKKNMIQIIKEKSVIKTIGRGTICVPLTNYDQINDVANFVKFFQFYHKQQIADLKEIAINRNLV